VDIAERHRKPVLFVVNGATARARITGEAAVALSQHGTVAPVTIHHRVDFAASMVDGRTVGEVEPKSQSAREVRELWNYIQDRLYRLARDPALVPQIPAAKYVLGPLSSYDAVSPPSVQADTGESPDVIRASETPEQDTPQRTEIADRTERRLLPERRQTLGSPPHGTAERRAHPFGRRHSDVPFPVR
jgi:chromosome partitioning protein